MEEMEEMEEDEVYQYSKTKPGPIFAAIENILRCAICREVSDPPVSLPCCQQVFCSLCIREYLAVTTPRCPVCRGAAAPSRLVLSKELRSVCNLWKKNRKAIVATANASAEAEARRAKKARKNGADGADATDMVLETPEQSRRSGAEAGGGAEIDRSLGRQRVKGVHYHTITEAKMRTMLRSLGLPHTGDKATMERRHRRLVLLDAASADRETPLPRDELVRQVTAWSREKDREKSAAARQAGSLATTFAAASASPASIPLLPSSSAGGGGGGGGGGLSTGSGGSEMPLIPPQMKSLFATLKAKGQAQAAARKRARAEDRSNSSSSNSVRAEESKKRTRVEGAAAATGDGESSPAGQSASVLSEATTSNRQEVKKEGRGYGAAVPGCREGGAFVDVGEETEILGVAGRMVRTSGPWRCAFITGDAFVTPTISGSTSAVRGASCKRASAVATAAEDGDSTARACRHCSATAPATGDENPEVGAEGHDGKAAGNARGVDTIDTVLSESRSSMRDDTRSGGGGCGEIIGGDPMENDGGDAVPVTSKRRNDASNPNNGLLLPSDETVDHQSHSPSATNLEEGTPEQSSTSPPVQQRHQELALVQPDKRDDKIMTGDAVYPSTDTCSNWCVIAAKPTLVASTPPAETPLRSSSLISIDHSERAADENSHSAEGLPSSLITINARPTTATGVEQAGGILYLNTTTGETTRIPPPELVDQSEAAENSGEYLIFVPNRAFVRALAASSSQTFPPSGGGPPAKRSSMTGARAGADHAGGDNRSKPHFSAVANTVTRSSMMDVEEINVVSPIFEKHASANRPKAPSLSPAAGGGASDIRGGTSGVKGPGENAEQKLEGTRHVLRGSQPPKPVASPSTPRDKTPSAERRSEAAWDRSGDGSEGGGEGTSSVYPWPGRSVESRGSSSLWSLHSGDVTATAVSPPSIGHVVTVRGEGGCGDISGYAPNTRLPGNEALNTKGEDAALSVPVIDLSQGRAASPPTCAEANGGGGSAENDIKDSKWACTRCTLENDDSVRTCDVCGAPKPERQSPQTPLTT